MKRILKASADIGFALFEKQNTLAGIVKTATYNIFKLLDHDLKFLGNIWW